MIQDKKVQEFYGSLLFNQYGLALLPGLAVLSFIYGLKEAVWISLSCWVILLFSRFWAAHSLQKVILEERVSAGEIFPGEETRLEIRVSNHKRLPVPWLNIETGDFHPDPESSAQSVYTEAKDQGRVCQIGWLPGRDSLVVKQAYTLSRRGVYHIGASKIRSGDPFKLFFSEQVHPGGTELLVYPPLLDFPWQDFGRKYPNGNIADQNAVFTDPAYKIGLKDYEPSDSLRSVNWPATARYQTLKANIAEGKAVSRSVLFLEAAGIWKGNYPQEKKELAWELLVSGVASLAMHLSSQDKEWSFITNLQEEKFGRHNKMRTETNSSSSHNQLRLLLARLACLHLSAVQLSAEKQLALTKGQSGATLIIFAAAYDSKLQDTIRNTTQYTQIKWFVLEEKDLSQGVDAYLLKPGWAEDPELFRQLLG